MADNPAQRQSEISATYDEVAAEYSERIANELDGKPLDRALLDLFAQHVAAGARVCDAGCGPGHVSRYLRDRGVNVYGVDISPRMIDQALLLNPEIEFKVGDLTTLEGEPRDLAAVIAFYSLIHLPRTSVAEALRQIREHLRPAGLLFAGFHLGADELHLDEWWGRSVSIDFTFFTLDEMRSYFVNAGFALEWVIEREPYEGVEHPSRRGYILGRKDESVSEARA